MTKIRNTPNVNLDALKTNSQNHLDSHLIPSNLPLVVLFVNVKTEIRKFIKSICVLNKNASIKTDRHAINPDK